MIKPNEVRLGNWVEYYIESYRKLNYQQLGYEYFILKGAGKEFDIKPIALTPEILEKAGFIKWNHDGTEFEPSYLLNFDDHHPCSIFTKFHVGGRISLGIFSPASYVLELPEIIHPINPSIKYLHQLQNLYFALTNEELKIDL